MTVNRALILFLLLGLQAACDEEDYGSSAGECDIAGTTAAGKYAVQEIVMDEYALSVPPDAPSGGYALRVGLYLPESGQRLSVPGSADNAVTLPLTIMIR